MTEPRSQPSTSDHAGPLADVRIVEVAIALTGPYASALYTMCNRGKRSIALDIHRDEGRDIVRALARDADVFVQNFRPGIVDRLGLGYDVLAAENPDLVYASLSGFGPEGPYAPKGAYATVIQAYAGLASNQADPDTGTPRSLNQTAADKVASLYAA